jgi:hypothetical protein
VSGVVASPFVFIPVFYPEKLLSREHPACKPSGKSATRTFLILTLNLSSTNHLIQEPLHLHFLHGIGSWIVFVFALPYGFTELRHDLPKPLIPHGSGHIRKVRFMSSLSHDLAYSANHN